MATRREREPFLIYKRGKTLYAKFLNPETDEYDIRRSTGVVDRGRKGDRSAAAKTAQQMLDQGLAQRAADENVIDYCRRHWQEKRGITEYYRNEQLRFVEFAAQFKPFSTKQLSTVTIGFTNQLSDYLAKHKSARTAQRMLQAITVPLRRAKSRGLAPQLDLSVGVDRPKAKLRERGRLSIEEIRSILDLTVTEYPDPRELAGTLLATLAGLRRSELRALRWRDVDVENHQIVVSEGYTDGDGFHAAKADSGGRVEVPAVLLEKLAEYKQWTPFDDDEHLLLFGASEGGRIRSVSNWRRNSATGHTPMAARAVTRGFNRVLEAIGISDEERRRRNLVLHSGRHTFASLATERLSVFAAQRLTRHSDIRVLQGYAHPEASETKRFGTDLDDELAQRRKDGSQ